MEKPTSHQSGTFSSWGWKSQQWSRPLKCYTAMSQNPDTLLTQKSFLIPNIILAFDPRNSWFSRLSAAVHPPGLSCTFWKSERTRAFSSSPRESQDLPETTTGGQRWWRWWNTNGVDSSDMSTCLMQDLYMFSMISIVDIRLYIYICYISSIKPPLCLATNNSLRHLCSTSVLDGSSYQLEVV